MINGMDWYVWEAGNADEEPEADILTCSDCPPDECSGHCFSCMYGAQ